MSIWCKILCPVETFGTVRCMLCKCVYIYSNELLLGSQGASFVVMVLQSLQIITADKI